MIQRSRKRDGFIDHVLVAAELAVRDHRAERLDHHAHAEQRGDVGGVVRRRDFHHLQPAQAFGRHQPQNLQRLARQEAARFRPAGAGHETAIDASRRRTRCRPRRRPSTPVPARSRRSFPARSSRCRRWSAHWCCACAPPARRSAAPASRRCRAAPDWSADTLGKLVAQYHGVVCMRSSRSFSWMSIWRSKWMMPMRFDVHCAMPRTQGKPIE